MTTPAVSILFGGLMAWGIYRRVRRNVGRQPLRPRRIIFSLVVFSLVGLLLAVTSFQAPRLFGGLGGGLALGAVLGFLGLRLTQFETTEAGHFYTPNTPIGVALSVLFLGRMLYRLWVLHDANPAAGQPKTFQSPLTHLHPKHARVLHGAGQPQMFQSPLTLFIFGLIAGYYLVYCTGLFVHTHDRK